MKLKNTVLLKMFVIPECFYRGYDFRINTGFPITPSGMIIFIRKIRCYRVLPIQRLSHQGRMPQKGASSRSPLAD